MFTDTLSLGEQLAACLVELSITEFEFIFANEALDQKIHNYVPLEPTCALIGWEEAWRKRALVGFIKRSERFESWQIN